MGGGECGEVGVRWLVLEGGCEVVGHGEEVGTIWRR